MPFSRRKKRTVHSLRCGKSSRRKKQATPVTYRVHWSIPIIFIFTIVFFISLYLCNSSKIISTQYRITQLKQKQQNLIAEKKKIQLEIEQLDSLERVEQVAKTQFNMIEPTDRYTITVTSSTRTAQLPEELISNN